MREAPQRGLFSTAVESRPEACELVFTRTIAAPRELVFRAFTDPQLLAQW